MGYCPYYKIPPPGPLRHCYGLLKTRHKTPKTVTDSFVIENYQCIKVPRPESINIRGKGKRGHGGICLFVNDLIYDGIEVLEKNSKGFLWVKVKKSFFCMETDLFICFCYIPPKDSIYFKNVDSDLFDILENGIRQYSDFGKVSVIGDLNARTGMLSDEPVGCDDIDRYIDSVNGAELNTSSGYDLGRQYSLDVKSDSSGLRLLNICKEASLRIVNGRVGLDKNQGNFTYQSTLGKSVIDYVLLQPEMFENTMHFAVHGIYTFSDHAPVQISFRIKKSPDVEGQNKTVHKLIWDKDRIDCFRNALSDNLVDIDLLVDRIENGNLNINDGVETFSNILYNSANQVCGKTITVKSDKSSSKRKYISPWFTIDCEIARSELKRANKEFRKQKSHEAHEVLLRKRKHYSKVKRRAQTVYKQNERVRLHDLASSNPKAFWPEIRRMKGDNSKNATLVCMHSMPILTKFIRKTAILKSTKWMFLLKIISPVIHQMMMPRLVH